MKNILSILFVLAISISVNAQKVLFLDAGHGGKDQGAVSATGISEASINQTLVEEIKEAAEAKGFKVVLLSDAKTFISLKDRVKKANEYQLKEGEKSILISIHTGYSENPLKKGAEVFVMPTDKQVNGTKELANSLAKSLNSTIHEKGLTILRDATMPAVLIESGYISNEQDLVDLQTPDMRTSLVMKIITAIQ